jgi:NTP pyrophosphatase (non-canonical NTP hydrolase)
VLNAVAQERVRQNELWGEQNHPMLDVPFCTGDSWAAYQALKESFCTKEVLEACRKLNDSGRTSWFSILLEEVLEAFEEIDLKKQREEMVQVAAVCVQIIEYLDRQAGEREEGSGEKLDSLDEDDFRHGDQIIGF